MIETEKKSSDFKTNLAQVTADKANEGLRHTKIMKKLDDTEESIKKKQKKKRNGGCGF